MSVALIVAKPFELVLLDLSIIEVTTYLLLIRSHLDLVLQRLQVLELLYILIVPSTCIDTLLVTHTLSLHEWVGFSLLLKNLIVVCWALNYYSLMLPSNSSSGIPSNTVSLWSA